MLSRLKHTIHYLFVNIVNTTSYVLFYNYVYDLLRNKDIYQIAKRILIHVYLTLQTINVHIISLHNSFWFSLICTNYNSRCFSTAYNNILHGEADKANITEGNTELSNPLHLSFCVTFTFVFSFHIWKKLIRKLVCNSLRFYLHEMASQNLV